MVRRNQVGGLWYNKKNRSSGIIATAPVGVCKYSYYE